MKYNIYVCSDSYYNDFYKGNDWKHKVVVTRAEEDAESQESHSTCETEETQESQSTIEAEVVEETTIEIPPEVEECYIVYRFSQRGTDFICEGEGDQVIKTRKEAMKEFMECIESVNRELYEYLCVGTKVVNIIDAGDGEEYKSNDVRMTTIYEHTPYGLEFPDVGCRYVVQRLVRGVDYR